MSREEVIGVRWGTWEELLLGGAVLRHGTQDWDLVSSELRARTVSPFIFTPQVCKAKYEDLEQHYAGCLELFEELRKQRMAELKQALEKSEGSIGSLETKLETLKAERKNDGNVGCDSSQTESVIPFQKSDGVESSSKETSKDGLSAGSFTQETRSNWSPKSQIPDPVVEDIETKPDVSVSPKQEKVLGVGDLVETLSIGLGRSIRRRRGKRKRKGSSKDMKEGSVGDSELWGSADVLSASRCKDNSTSTSDHTGRCLSGDDKSLTGKCSGIIDKSQTGKCLVTDDKSQGKKSVTDVKSQTGKKSVMDDKSHTGKKSLTDDKSQTGKKSVKVDKSRVLKKDEHAHLVAIFDSIAENKCATVFRHRLDSQKRGRYKKMILQHMDIDTLRSRISSHSITSLKEVFRDLLLLANNALVFYSKTTREYKSAAQLREIVTKSLRENLKEYISKSTINLLSNTPKILQPPVKPRSDRPSNRKLPEKASKAGNSPAAKTPNASKKQSNAASPASAESLTTTNKRSNTGSRAKKAGQETAMKQPEKPPKGRKRARAR